ALYALLALANRLVHVSTFSLLRFSFYFTLAALVGSLVAVAVHFSSRLRGRSFTLFWGLYVALSLLGLRYAGLPLLHLLQANGAFPQLWSLLPILALFWLQAAERSRGTWLAIVTTFALVRYSYAINLGDLAFTLGIITLAEATNAPRWRHAMRLAA